MFLIPLSDFDDPIRRGKSVNRFYNYMYFCLKYRNIFFTVSGITYSSTKCMINADTVSVTKSPPSSVYFLYSIPFSRHKTKGTGGW